LTPRVTFHYKKANFAHSPKILHPKTSRFNDIMKFAAILALAGLALATPEIDPSQIYLSSISYGGTGCPQGSVGSSFSNDRQSFTLIFDSFVASTGPGVPLPESRKNCQLNLNVHMPQGFSYSIATFDYRGYVQLPAGATAEQKSIYYFQGEAAQASAGTRFSGPVSKDYLSRDTLGVVAWMPCGRIVPVNVNAQVRVTAPAGQQAQITTDSIDGKVRTILGLQYRNC
jgi:hypothetical protein